MAISLNRMLKLQYHLRQSQHRIDSQNSNTPRHFQGALNVSEFYQFYPYAVDDCAVRQLVILLFH